MSPGPGRPFAEGHKMNLRDPLIRFWEKVDKNGPIPEHRPDLGPCWIWHGQLSREGYARFTLPPDREKARRVGYAHIFAYQLLVGEIPEGQEIDHLCRNRGCPNPSHMEAVTHKENTLRGEAPAAIHARKTHCIRGHEFTLQNTSIRITRIGRQRTCRTCKCNRQNLKRRAEKWS